MGMSSSLATGIRSALALTALAVLVSGCASAPGSTPPSGVDVSDAPPVHTQLDDLAAAWLADGRSIAIVTWGSSTPTCRPSQIETDADGQELTVTLHDHPEASKECTDDLVPRAEQIMVPEGVDVTRDVTLKIQHEKNSGTVTLPALTGDLPSTDEYGASAGWFADDGIVLLTYGSSSCRPHVDNVTLTDGGATVALSSSTGMCTMDMAPRLTPVVLPEAVDRDADFELTLTGEVDATIGVLG